MLRLQNFDRVRQMFAERFEPDGPNFLYRKNIKSAPIRVSEAERNTFVATFNRRLRYLVWMMIAATLLLIGLLIALIPNVDGPSAHLGTYVGLGCIFAPWMVGYYWAWNGPTRELERRPAVAQAPTREEVRRLKFSKMTYGQLGFAVMTASFLLWKEAAKTDVFHGWGILWLMFAAALIVGATVQAFRKWRFERS
jgi:hypothetical protein